MTGDLCLLLLIPPFPVPGISPSSLSDWVRRSEVWGPVAARPLAPALIAMNKAITREMPSVRERSRDYILFYLVIVVMECTNEFELYYTCVFI
jgi:hypothetical protein